MGASLIVGTWKRARLISRVFRLSVRSTRGERDVRYLAAANETRLLDLTMDYWPLLLLFWVWRWEEERGSFVRRINGT